MKIIDIVKLTNKYLAGEQLTYDRLLPFLDAVVDDINNSLSSTFPAFSSITFSQENANTVTYSAIPDRYIRSVICVGAAHKFFLVDDEGVDNAQGLGNTYHANLFYMTRDYLEKVPEFYQNDTSGGVVLDEYGQTLADPFDMRGIL